MSKIADLIAAKRKAKAEAEFPASIAITLALRINPDIGQPIDKLNLLFDWLGPFNIEGLPSEAGPYWRWMRSWKTLAIAQRINCPEQSVIAQIKEAAK